MAQWTSRTLLIHRKEYAVPATTDWIEVSRVMSAINQYRSDKRLPTDDTSVRVRADDEEIVFWWEEVVETRH